VSWFDELVAFDGDNAFCAWQLRGNECRFSANIRRKMVART
jgi:hypothetical protein